MTCFWSCRSVCSIFISVFLSLLVGKSGGINPTVIINPCPVCAGDTVFIEVSGMPPAGTWTITVTYSDGTADPPTSVTGSSSGSTRSCAPAGAVGGTMVVTVQMGGNSSSTVKPVRSCP